MTDQLKPCPFCGGEVHLIDDIDECTLTVVHDNEKIDCILNESPVFIPASGFCYELLMNQWENVKR